MPQGCRGHFHSLSLCSCQELPTLHCLHASLPVRPHFKVPTPPWSAVLHNGAHPVCTSLGRGGGRFTEQTICPLGHQIPYPSWEQRHRKTEGCDFSLLARAGSSRPTPTSRKEALSHCPSAQAGRPSPWTRQGTEWSPDERCSSPLPALVTQHLSSYPSFQVWIFSSKFLEYYLVPLYHKIILKTIWCQPSSWPKEVKGPQPVCSTRLLPAGQAACEDTHLHAESQDNGFGQHRPGFES